VDVASLVVPPRVCHLPEYDDDSLGVEAVEFARSLGLQLDPWQEMFLSASLHRRKGRWASFENVLETPRQCGKNVVLEARELFALFVLEMDFVIHSGHDWAVTMQSFDRVLAILEDNPELDRRVAKKLRSHASEGFNLEAGGRMRFRTRSRGGGRGFSCDLLTFDEANFLPDFAVASLLPSLRAKQDAQVLYAGTAADQLTQKDSVVLARLRERALAGEDQGLLYMEWSTVFEDEDGNELGPDRVTAEMAADQAKWLEATPAAPQRVSLEHLELEFRSMSLRNFLTECLGVGDWPSTTGEAPLPIALEDWGLLIDPKSKPQSPVCLGVDVGPNLQTSIALAGRRLDGLTHVEVIDSRPGTSWVPARLAQLDARHEPWEICIDPYGFAAPLADQIEAAGVRLRRLKAGDVTAACGTLLGLVTEAQLRHLGDPDLLKALQTASTRPLGDSWCWARRSSAADITTLVASTIAVWSAQGSPQDDEGPVIW
jgi:hypothetical protein